MLGQFGSAKAIRYAVVIGIVHREPRCGLRRQFPGAALAKNLAAADPLAAATLLGFGSICPRLHAASRLQSAPQWCTRRRRRCDHPGEEYGDHRTPAPRRATGALSRRARFSLPNGGGARGGESPGHQKSQITHELPDLMYHSSSKTITHRDTQIQLLMPKKTAFANKI